MTTNTHFPWGRNYGPIPLLFVGFDTDHALRMARIMPIPGAMFVGPGAQLAGVSIQEVIVCKGDPDDEWRVRNWVDEVVRTRMTPGRAERIEWL